MNCIDLIEPTAMEQRFVYKILTADDWSAAQANGVTATDLDAADGYVHLSARDQVGETLRLHYSGAEGAVLLEFETAALGDDLLWEPSRGGALFPHLYGDLRVGEARRRWTLSVLDGRPQLPDDL